MPRLLFRRLFATGLLLLSSQVGSQSLYAQAGKHHLLIGTTKSENTFFGTWEQLIYTEAFARLNIQIEFIKLPITRLTTAIEQEDIDAVMSRTRDYGAVHPSLVRVNESLFSVTFAIYTANPALQATELNDLPANLFGEYRREVVVCKNALKPLLPAEQLSEILTTVQGIRKLVSQRTDFFCDVDIAILNELFLSKTTEFHAVRKLFNVGPPSPLYPYLSKKNAALAPRLAAALKKMKAEGLIEQYRVQAEESVGWPKKWDSRHSIF